MLFIFLDTETTGVNPERHRIIEIAYKMIDVMEGRVQFSYETIVSQPPEVFALADSDSLKVNGFNYEMALQGKPEAAVAVDIIHSFNAAKLEEKGGLFVCQNPSFDRLFFNQLIDADIQEKYGWPYHWLDLASMYMAVRLTKDKWSYRLLKEKGLSKDKIAAYYGLPPEVRPHRAMNGVLHLLACYEAIFGSFGARVE